jgi:hypothetical protein
MTTERMSSDDARDPGPAYEPPVVEDLDSGRGPVETAAGVIGPSTQATPAAAPREL